MSELNLMGPALRLVYAYLGLAYVSDDEKIEFAGALIGLVAGYQLDATKLKAAIEATGIRISPAMPQPGGEISFGDLILSAGIDDGDWTAEDDRLVLVGRIADTIETMPHHQLQRLLVLAQHIRDE